VLALDPVAMSYLMDGTGPLQVGQTQLTSDTLVKDLLSTPYLELELEAQDALFAETARVIFDSMTGDLQDPMAFVQGLARATDEGRFLVAPFDTESQQSLEGSEVLGALPEDDGKTPFVDISLNDSTASKMSYYLRYHADVRAASCIDGRQRLNGSMSLWQSIDASEAAQLPDSVIGPGDATMKLGEQAVAVRIAGPHGGTVEDIRIDGKAVRAQPVMIDGRPTATIYVFLNSADDVEVNWSMQGGRGQSGHGQLGMTPGVVRGDNDGVFAGAC
jgi:hypothetical protein